MPFHSLTFIVFLFPITCRYFTFVNIMNSLRHIINFFYICDFLTITIFYLLELFTELTPKQINSIELVFLRLNNNEGI